MRRRTFLKAAGLSLALPCFKSLGEVKETEKPDRLLCMSMYMSFYPQAFFPKAAGRNYLASDHLKILDKFRRDYTVFSGLSHKNVQGGHRASTSLFNGFGQANKRNPVSIDQLFAEKYGSETRYPSLSLIAGAPAPSSQISWDRQGQAVYSISEPVKLFNLLFGVDLSVKEQRAAMARKQSILDAVMKDASSLKRKLNTDDKDMLEEYFSSVRDVEKKLLRDERWLSVKKPNVKYRVRTTPYPTLIESLPVMLDLIHLAFKTDSTRSISLQVSGGNRPINLAGVNRGYHNLSHHGKDPDKIKQLLIIEKFILRQLSSFFAKMKTSEGGGSLLDKTQTIIAGPMGNANAHFNRDLPVLLAGGGYNHGSHLVSKGPLSSLFLTVLQKAGLEISSFADSNGTISI